ncbi:2-hydroxychromene-2-carboxylate isomerase/DsbA-like thioredoxin domain [Collimonas arenae]|uniref:2-hydroxychromene-2-carboxylate isomerase/DsbA-like thioredoxin domain n=1 Tax=Collimonas arenae TaxID=279058 RepID=A0A0A1FB38_9BURK|nr:DsbA family oxidoreductase [Collimonas arenae]AIY41721.1 2-hydroxychromene-2-carboxylate isomerase/DsbA-like thioredoxin domain [Collimonas arenae]
MTSILDIDVTFDLVCPWCLIGKRNLDRALESVRKSYPGIMVRIHWHGVQLLPDVPSDGVPFASFYEKRLGSKAAVRMRQAQVSDAAERAGLTIRLDRISLFPNTGKAHRLLKFAANSCDTTQYEALLERLFAAYFVHGENIGDEETLIKIAQSFGLSPDKLNSWQHEDAASDIGQSTHSGVPFFVFNQRYTLAGAQPPETLFSLMQTLIEVEFEHDTLIPATA